MAVPEFIYEYFRLKFRLINPSMGWPSSGKVETPAPGETTRIEAAQTLL